MSIKSIQKPVGQLQILVHLYKNETAIHADFKNDVGLNSRTLYSALSNLIDLKLVRKLSNNDYKLTKKGEKIAKPLIKIEKLLPK
jgi:predicted transcriptional regulator